MTTVSTTVFPELRGKDKKGDIRIWKTWVKGNEYLSASGKVGGKLKTNSRSASITGKKSAEEQALFCAKRNWDRYVKKGYSQHNVEEKLPELAENLSGKGKRLESVGMLPMLCKVWEGTAEEYFDFDVGVYIQPKLDGIRAIISYKDGEVVMTTRTGKVFKFLDHIRDAAKAVLKVNQKLVLDGEFYAHSISKEGKEITDAAERFQIITAACRPVLKRPHALEAQMQFHIFDLALPGTPLVKRIKILDESINPQLSKEGILRRVETRIIKSKDEINSSLDEITNEGYEGIIIRAHDLDYEPARKSLKMRKLKKTQSEEFDIVGAECDPGVETENFVWVCKTQDGVKFRVKETGPVKKRKKLFQTYTEYVGKPLTVEFQELSPQGIPRFPRSKGIRDEFVN